MHKFIHHGWIELICGPMFAGKTEELLKRLDKIKHAKINYIVFKPKLDTRTPGKISSRSKKSEEAIEINNSNEIFDYLKNSNTYQVIAIDEAQFLDKSIVDVCMKLSRSGYHIIISGLDKNFKGEPFSESISLLMAIADDITKLSAACHNCGSTATFTKLLKNSLALNDQNILIGDNDLYVPCCYEHHKYND